MCARFGTQRGRQDGQLCGCPFWAQQVRARVLKQPPGARGLLQAAARRKSLHGRRGLHISNACAARSHSMLCMVMLALEQPRRAALLRILHGACNRCRSLCSYLQ